MKDIAKWAVYAGIFAVPFIPLIIANSLFFPFITGKNFAFRIIVEVIFASWIILALYEPVYRPKFSWIVTGMVAFIGVMFFANLFGEYPLASFWSNFERMEGYVTLVHFFVYFLVVGSVLTTEKLWNRFFNTTLVAAVILALYAFAQLSGNIAINQGGLRLDGTLGNSAYMAIYTLFHVFIAGLMLVRTESRRLRYVYAALIALFVFLLVQTATRGTTLGLIGGAFISVAYIALFERQYVRVRKVAFGGLICVVLITGAFFAARDTDYIREHPIFSRIASISLEAGETRFTIWGMAFEGFKEHPVLGWGQSNFNYAFNKYYKPSLYGQESWFDRVHNIVMDWMIAGGILGVLTYFSIFFSAIYYLFIRPLWKHDERFTITERGVLLGLLAGYLVHNFFVFDNIVSYIYYGTILAFIHSRVGVEIPKIQFFKIDQRVIEQIATPVVAVVLIGTVYYINIPGLRAAGDIIDAFMSDSPEVMLAEFEEALSRNSFADQEIREQMTRQVQSIIQSPQVSEEMKQAAFKRVEEELLKQAAEKPGDARVHVFISSFYRMTRNIDPAIEHLAIARDLSPEKQQIIFEQGLAYMQKQDYPKALEFFKEAYDLEPAYEDAHVFYAIGYLYNGQPERVRELINTEALMKKFARNDLAISAAYNAKEYDLLKEMFTIRIAEKPTDSQLRVNLAVVHYELGDTAGAVEVLRKAGEEIPAFKTQSEQFINDLEAGRLPGQQPAVSVDGMKVESSAE